MENFPYNLSLKGGRFVGYDLKTMYIVRGKLMIAAFDLAKSRGDRDTVKILCNAIDIIENKIFDKELPDKIERYKNLFDKKTQTE